MVPSLSTLFLGLLLAAGPDLVGNSRRIEGPPATTVSFLRLPEPPPSVVRVGDRAPNFSYQGYDGRWMRLHHLLDQGPLLLVFGADDAQLEALQREREDLLALGVIPVVVVERTPARAKDLVRRHGLQYTMLADHRRVIAGQFNTVEGGRVTPAWFAIDPRGRVRGLQRGQLPGSEVARLCARALALPLPGSIRPASR